jgi:hypothetical protein
MVDILSHVSSMHVEDLLIKLENADSEAQALSRMITPHISRSLRELSLMFTNFRGVSLDPLYACHLVEIIHLNGPSLEVNDSIIESAAKAWPSLRNLVVNQHMQVLDPYVRPQATLLGLRHFARSVRKSTAFALRWMRRPYQQLPLTVAATRYKPRHALVSTFAP